MIEMISKDSLKEVYTSVTQLGCQLSTHHYLPVIMSELSVPATVSAL